MIKMIWEWRNQQLSNFWFTTNKGICRIFKKSLFLLLPYLTQNLKDTIPVSCHNEIECHPLNISSCQWNFVREHRTSARNSPSVNICDFRTELNSLTKIVAFDTTFAPNQITSKTLDVIFRSHHRVSRFPHFAFDVSHERARTSSL